MFEMGLYCFVYFSTHLQVTIF